MRGLSWIILGLLVSSCAKFEDHGLLAASPNANDSLVWDMVNLKGLDDALLAKNQADIVEQINFKYTDLGDFEVRAGLTKDPVKKRSLLIHFKACNGSAASYGIRGAKLRYKSHVGTAMLCGTSIETETGEQVINDTPLIVEILFHKLAPQITHYEVSRDGLTLKFLNENDEAIGVFTREAAE